MLFVRSLLLLITTQWLYILPAIAAPNPLSQACRAELINEVSRKWNDINGLLINDTFSRVAKELEDAKLRGDREITINTLEFAVTYLSSQTRDLASQDYPKLAPLLDRMVELARSLPSRHSSVKTNVLTQTGKAYQKIGQPATAKQTLRLAAQSVSGIQGNPMIAQAQIQLAESWITTNQFSEATIALNIALEQTSKAKQDAFYRREALSKIVNLYLQAGQPDRALSTANLLPLQDYESVIVMPQIAASYIKTKNLVRAKQILDPLLKRVLALKDLEQRDAQLKSIVIHYAPSGDVIQLQKIRAEMKRPNHYRASALLAIAGEARNVKQTQIRTQAISQLISDIKAAKMEQQLGERYDHQWFGEMFALANERNYQPELTAIVMELRPSNLLGIVLQELINQKQFEMARRTVPKPMYIQVDAAVNDESDFWLDRIAIAQLKAGEPEAAAARMTAENQPVRSLLQFAEAFHQAGNRPLTDQAFQRARTIAKTMPEQAAIVNAMSQAGYATDPVLNELAAALRKETVISKRAEVLLSLSPEFSDARKDYLALADRAGLTDRVEYITRARKEALSENRLDEAYRLLSSPKQMPSENFDFILQLVEFHLKRGELMAARSILDMPIRSLLDGPDSSKPPQAEISSLFHRISLNLARAGDPEYAIELSRYITPLKEREQLQQRLRCFVSS